MTALDHAKVFPELAENAEVVGRVLERDVQNFDLGSFVLLPDGCPRRRADIESLGGGEEVDRVERSFGDDGENGTRLDDPLGRRRDEGIMEAGECEEDAVGQGRSSGSPSV